MAETFAVIDSESGRYDPIDVTARVEGDRVYLDPAAVQDSLGWSLREEGLCRGDVCVPVRNRESLLDDGAIDLGELATLLDRPLAIDAQAGVAVLGTSAGERARQMESLEAPDFELPDLAGRMHRLSEHRGKKVLLIAHASW